MGHEPNPANQTSSPSWRTITAIRDQAARQGGGVPQLDRCAPEQLSYDSPTEGGKPTVAFTQGCGSEGTMLWVAYGADDPDSDEPAGIARVCIECDAAHLWPRYAEAA